MTATPHPERRSPAHFDPVTPHNRSVIIFVTICTRDRGKILANPNVHQLLREAWQQATYWLVGRYIILPDHLHFFCAPATIPEFPLGQWISYWQKQVTRQWTIRDGLPLWQRDYWDRQLRQAESYGDKWEYVRHNPVRHGLVKNPDDWPYQGEMNILEWHD